MREIKPFKSGKALQKAIDNVGRFWNLFTHANDQVVSKAALAKAAGGMAESAFDDI